MNEKPFKNEEPALRVRPQSIQPMSKVHKRIAMGASVVVAILVWSAVKDHLQKTKHQNISNMQAQAGELGEPIVVDTSKQKIGNKITGVLIQKEEKENTVIINPPGVEPAIQVITPDATISAGTTGEIEKIIPTEDTTEKPLTPTEAQSTVDKAVKDAAEKTLPKEEPTTPLKLKID